MAKCSTCIHHMVKLLDIWTDLKAWQLLGRAGGCVSPLCETPSCPASTSSGVHGGLVSTTQGHICSQWVQQQPTQFLICCPGRSVPYSAATSSSQRHPNGKGCFKQNSMWSPKGWRCWERAINMTTTSNIICYSKLSSHLLFPLNFFPQNFS